MMFVSSRKMLKPAVGSRCRVGRIQMTDDFTLKRVEKALGDAGCEVGVHVLLEPHQDIGRRETPAPDPTVLAEAARTAAHVSMGYGPLTSRRQD